MSLAQWQDLVPGPGLLPRLSIFLSILFESSPILLNKLVPELAKFITHSFNPPQSYMELVDISLHQLGSWTLHERALFISGHPRIGEVWNFSALSKAEQATKAMPPEVLKRLEILNIHYECAFPGLRYVTFVNGRSCADIVPEMEHILGCPIDPTRPSAITIHDVGDVEWLSELARAIHTVGLIAKSRVKALDL